MAESKPMLLGRFNYLSFRTDLFNVVFMPYQGATASVVARNLDKEMALNLIDIFNSALDAARKELKAEERADEEDEDE